MAVLDDNDPISILSDKIICILHGHDGGTVMAALALTLTTTLMWAEKQYGKPMPCDVRLLRDFLTDLVGDVVHTRNEQLES